MNPRNNVLDLATRRGFLWQSHEIYGGIAGFYDLGPLGTLMGYKIIDLWRKMFIRRHQEFVVEIKTPIITPAIVFKASGHEEHFTDYAVECKSCGRVYRADHLIEEMLKVKAEGLKAHELERLIREYSIKCPACGGELSSVRAFNLLFVTYVGPYSENNKAYLRPEAAQGMFVNFKKVYEYMRRRMPLGIAQIGRVARNEISPRQRLIRLREFTIMEMEFFFDPRDPKVEILYERCSHRKIRVLRAEDKMRGGGPIEVTPVEAYEEKIIMCPWLAYWMCVAQEFIEALGVPYKDTMFEEKAPHELAHYSKQTFDQLVRTERWGWIEVSGHAYRYDYDLSRHTKFSGEDLYALRRLKEPKLVRREQLRIDKKIIIEHFGRSAAEVFRTLHTIPQDKLIKIVKESTGEFVKIKNFEIPKSALKIEVVEEKVDVEKFLPHVAEPSFGLERLIYVALEHAYREDNERVYLALPPYIAPIQVAVFPLVSREPLTSIAHSLYKDLAEEFDVIYDDSGTIGRRYARADEIGVPLAVTIDYKTVEDHTVTIRDRDSKKQVRVPMPKVAEVVRQVIRGAKLLELGFPEV
ncbi:MAG: glycine--tRNA ligase [Thermoprotei archaeon]|nr:MAG: glycine--tRNA ligase [Thermoprotei archaeon]